MENRKLKDGYTTGSCAAAAAWAAAYDLCSGSPVTSVDISLPDGSRHRFATEKVDAPFCCYSVQKDAGDDPDVTDKIYVCASCQKISHTGKAEMMDGHQGKGYLMEGDPPIYIDGGPGIGVVTREGLTCPVGHYAINPVPREEIARAVREACERCGKTDIPDGLLITISAPEGVQIAEKTFNPRLGITGGISILGTSGIVHPMSEEALLDTIRLELHMRAVNGMREVILTPGNYGETFLRKRIKVPEGQAVMISNFVRDAVLMAGDEGFKRILFAGHAGKLIKVAAGFPNTHSRYGDKRMETFISILEGLPEPEIEEMAPSLRDKIMNANTTDEALDILSNAFPDEPEYYVTTFLDSLALAVCHQLDAWAEGALSSEVIVFSRGGDVGSTEGVKKYLQDQ